MGFGKVILLGCRVLQTVVAAGVIGLGAWILLISHDVEIRGAAILRTTQFEREMRERWNIFFDAMVSSHIRVWVAVAAACFTFLIAIFTTLATSVGRFRVNQLFLIILELLAMMSMAAAFAVALTYTVKLSPLCAPLVPATSSDLTMFKTMCPVDTSFSVTAGVGWLLIAVTSSVSLFQACHKRKQKSCSFEPTASSLGMSHEYQTRSLVLRDGIPTIYDPQKPMTTTSTIVEPLDEEVALRGAAAGMGKWDLYSNEVVRGGGTDKFAISGPFALQEPDWEMQHRPVRPWNEMPKKK